MKPHHFRITGRWVGLTAAGVVVAAVFFVLGAGVRLLVGPVSLGPFSGQIAGAINRAVPGLGIRYDSAALEWSREEGRVNVVILGARVFDHRQRIIAQAPKAEIDLAAAPLLAGKLAVKRIALIGVQLTLVHSKDGSLHLGMVGDHGQSDLIARLRKILASNSGPTSLQGFAVQRARLAFFDERTGIFVVAPSAQLAITAKGGPRGPMTANLAADLEVYGKPAHIRAHLVVPQDGKDLTGDVELTGLDLAALGRGAAPLSFLKPYALKTDVRANFRLDQDGGHLAYVDFGIGAEGQIRSFGHPLRIRTLHLIGRYDGRTGRILIDDGHLSGKEITAHLRGSGNLAFDTDGALKTAGLYLEMDRLALQIPSVLQGQVGYAHAVLRADYRPAAHTITIEDFSLARGPLSAQFAGSVTLALGRSPAIALHGEVAALSVTDLLHDWPLTVAAGARSWIADNVRVGELGPTHITVALPAGALDGPVLPDDAIAVQFPISGATISYVAGLAPLTAVTGIGVLSGDAFNAKISSAVVTPPSGGALTLSAGSVAIADLHLPTTLARVQGHVTGALADVLSLIDMPPLRYPSRFHLAPQSARGQVGIDLTVKVPTRRDVTMKDVSILVKGKARGLALDIGHHRIRNGTATFSVNNSALHVAGRIGYAGALLDASWDEDFTSKDPETTHIAASGILDAAARARLGFDLGDYLEGPVAIQAELAGHRGDIRSADIKAVLDPATVTLNVINYRKPAGVPARVQLQLRLEKGQIASGQMVLTGASLHGQGTAQFNTDGKLVNLVMPQLHAGPQNDFSLNILDDASTGLKISVSGRSADGTGLDRLKLGGASAHTTTSSDRPFQFDVNLDRLVLHNGVVLAPFAFSAGGIGDRPQTLAMSGDLSRGAKVSADILVSAGERHVRLQATNAGLLLNGLFGFTSIRGGRLDLMATLSPKPTKKDLADKRVIDYRGVLHMTDFTVIHQPFLTRLFSAGSLTGLINLMGGKGIAVDKLMAPFRMDAGILNIDDARASGPSIGLTASGYFDRSNDKVALEGALVPIYGLNSVLGAIPVLGDVLVSKKGEGIFGVSYTVRGNADEPDVSVNPLSVLAPGILRRIFEGTPTAPVAKKDAADKAASDRQQDPSQP
ncbi:MAG: AsmA-like C-terminal domain-containing protein [Alphaproteobacteria bacterium]|nr:AsmA-like C-terminal domain-containing protein [Alphaproteobacteria bacterium]